ncbi:MAG: serine/threonine protein kinase [Lachnospiraceae bacterium]|nr:serine/threonine protein kinase [Lachnospiraceae bacterium]
MKEIRYKILKRLAEGGSGITYLVWDVRLEKKWVMKRIAFSAEPMREAARREIAALRSLHKEGIPVLTDVFYEENAICLVMEYLEGITLEEKVLREGALSQDAAVRYALQLAELLCFLHERAAPLIHGDLKPQNLMIKEDKVSLLDFGAAVFAGRPGGAFREDAEGHVCGRGAGCGDLSDMWGSGWYTPGYGAPELQRGEAASVRSDIYAFGAVLFYMLTGEDAGGSRGIYPIREQSREFPAWLELVILRCTEKQPEKRYASMREVVSALCERRCGGRRKRDARERRRTFQTLENILLTEAEGV